MNEVLRQFSPRLHKEATQNYYLRRPSQCASNFENKKSSCVIRNTRTSQKPFSALVFLRFFTKIFYSLGFLLEFFMIYIESLLPTVDFLCIDFFIRAFDNKFFQKGIYRAFKMLLTFGRCYPASTESLRKSSSLGKNKIIWKFKNLIVIFRDFRKLDLSSQISIEINHAYRSMY